MLVVKTIQQTLPRGCLVDDLPVSRVNGSPFLSNYMYAWPAQGNLVGCLQDEDPEVRRDIRSTGIVQSCQSGIAQHPINMLIEHHSSFYKLKKAVGWWLRLIQFLKGTEIQLSSPIGIHELRRTENLVKHVQGRAYFHEMNNIKAEKTVLKSSSIYKLSPIFIDGLLVVGEWTLSQVRKIIRDRKLMKRVKMYCIVCKRLYGAPMNQRMSDLPHERCEPEGPTFRCIGVDLLGPFYVKIRRSEIKRYAVRGYPNKVWSDNGTNLVGVRTELARNVRDLDRSLIVKETRRRDDEWSFNPPSASHRGGVWERMIRFVRKVLFALVIKSPRMVDDILQTLFCEAERIVNSRPLTKCSGDASDESPLTLNYLLLLQPNSPISWGAFHDANPYRKHWRHVQHLVKQFWKRWVIEYLVELQRRQKWNSEDPNLSVGDLVLVMNENPARGSWPLGRVQEVWVCAEVWVALACTVGGCDTGVGCVDSSVVLRDCFASNSR
ncbi:uncharacterized protein LOC143018113 [Oratosquilla oratoria]|uniref:uncharacterized protein LOC143018113 n=1 Tax=Oratosquilla oratoria TaxID=337810 RepID=UPI003F761D62